LDIVNAVKGPKGLKKEYFQKEYIKTRGIHPIYNCTKFQHDWTIFDFARLPQNFRENRSQGPKMGDFQKVKKKRPRHSSNLQV